MSELEDLLGRMHEVLGRELLRRIQEGEATSQDLNVARQFLRDNGIDAHMHKGGTLHRLTDALPFKDPDETLAQ